jgi:L,D-peptidoglycan transpeptidase YkuD (ErfK/YbiS/YcfS/YnhG family)
MPAGQPAAYDPTAVRLSALRAATAVRYVAPELSATLTEKIDLLEQQPQLPSADEWSDIHAVAHRALVAARARKLDDADSWERTEQRLDVLKQRARQFDEPWLARSARLKIGQVEALDRLARQAADNSNFVEAQRIAAPIPGLVGEIEHAHQVVMLRYQNPIQRQEWDRAARETIAASRSHSGTTHSGTIVIDKWNRRLHLAKSGTVVASWPIDLGKQPLERKLQQGDTATPEGTYRISRVKVGNATRFYKALLLDYPNQEDQRRYRASVRAGKASARGPGGLIEIHGRGARGEDWTDGCIAVADPVMDRLLRDVGTGTLVTIVGRMSEEEP